jgi:hypothetical protein
MSSLIICIIAAIARSAPPDANPTSDPDFFQAGDLPQLQCAQAKTGQTSDVQLQV